MQRVLKFKRAQKNTILFGLFKTRSILSESASTNQGQYIPGIHKPCRSRPATALGSIDRYTTHSRFSPSNNKEQGSREPRDAEAVFHGEVPVQPREHPVQQPGLIAVGAPHFLPLFPAQVRSPGIVDLSGSAGCGFP